MIYYDVYLMHSKKTLIQKNNEHADIYINSISLKIQKLFNELSLIFALTQFFFKLIKNQSSRTTQKVYVVTKQYYQTFAVRLSSFGSVLTHYLT